MAEELTTCEKVRRLRESHLQFWEKKYTAARELKAFLVGDRYQDDAGEFNRDRRLVQIRGQEIQDTIRHGLAKATEKPRSLEARPADEQGEPEAAELMVSLAEGELGNPWKCFEDEYEATIYAAKSTRIGILWMDWVPDFGTDGEIFYSWEDASRFMWDEDYMDPHHPLCGWLIRRRRMDTDKARKAYNAPWLEPDRDGKAVTLSRSDQPLLAHNRLAVARSQEDNMTTLDECWYKNDPAYSKKAPDTALPPERRYMACADGCGYRSDTQGMLQDAGKLEGELPDQVDGCPDCQGALRRVDTAPSQERVGGYSQGKRLVIVAPFCQGPEDKPVYDKTWPIPKARSFPILAITAYMEPGDPGGGQCDVDLMWDQQAAADQLDTAALQQVLEHRNFWLLPEVGVNDYKKERWEGRDDQFNMMFRDATAMGPIDVQMLNGTGVDPNFGLVRSGIQQRLTAYRGISDVGMVNEADTGQSGVAIAQRNQIGEIPSAHFNRRKNRALSKFVGVLSDYIAATYTPRRLTRIRADGMDIIARVWGQDLPAFDFAIEDSPDFSGLEEAKSKAFDGLINAIQQAMTLGFDPLEYVELFAEVNHFPRSIVRKVEKMLQSRQAMGAGGAVAGETPPGQGVAPGLSAPDQSGVNGGGMAPLPVQ